jgi:hypothetical protein
VNNLNLSGDKLNALLAIAGKKLGKSPEELKAGLQSGNLDSVLAGMSEENRKQITALLGNPAALNLLMQNENIKKLLGGLGKK